MYIYEFPFQCQLPKEVGSYVTLIRPFDEYTWILACAASSIFYLMLVVMELLWAYKSGRPSISDFLYQGINYVKLVGGKSGGVRISKKHPAISGSKILQHLLKRYKIS